MANDLIGQIYRAKMQTLLNKIAKDKQNQLDKEREAQIKQDEFWERLNVAGSVANVGKNIFEWRQGKLLEKVYDEPEQFSWGEKKRLKYKRQGMEFDKPLGNQKKIGLLGK